MTRSEYFAVVAEIDCPDCGAPAGQHCTYLPSDDPRGAEAEMSLGHPLSHWGRCWPIVQRANPDAVNMSAAV